MQTSKDTHYTPSGGYAPKEEVYGWVKVDTPGAFMWIDKNDLHIDERYQRPTDSARATIFSAKWSWIACGSLTVIRRDGKLFVADGGHRLEGALKVSSIKELPCLVFDCDNSEEEDYGNIVVRLPEELENIPEPNRTMTRDVVMVEGISSLVWDGVADGHKIIARGTITLTEGEGL